MEAARVVTMDRLRTAAAIRGEELLAEVPAVLRRIKLLLLVLAVSVPVFLVGCVGLLAWWLVG
jgi:hypothetical protein